MPTIGTIGEEKRACDVGLVGESWLRWSACPRCGKERWVRVKETSQFCVSCAAKVRARYDRPITYNGVGTPKIGDTVNAKLIGLTGDQIMFYDPCVVCSKPRWVRKGGKGTHCSRCAPKYHGTRRDRTQDGRYQEKGGYVHIRLEKDDPFWGMAGDGGWVPEHRIVVARRIGRTLTRSEVVHHINGIRWDNRDENLKLLTRATHHCYLVAYDHQTRIQSLEQRVTFLEAENTALHKQLASIANPEPSREISLSGVCRDLTGDTLQYEGEGKVHSSGKSEGECSDCSHRSSSFRRSQGLRPLPVMALKNPAKSVEPKSDIGYGNAELGSIKQELPSVETLHGTPFGVKTKSDSHRKVSQIGSTPLSPTSNNGVPVRQLTGKLVANSGNPKREYPHGNPELNGGVNAS